MTDPKTEIEAAMDEMFAMAADSKGMNEVTKRQIMQTLLHISEAATTLFDMVENDAAFHITIPRVLTSISEATDSIKLSLAAALLDKNPDALHFAMKIRENQRRANGL